MTIYNVADILTGLVEAVLLFRMYETFCRTKEGLSKLYYIIGIIALALMINLSNIVFSYGILNAVGMGIAFLLPSFLFKGKFSIKLISAFLTIVLIGITEIIVLFGITIIYGITVSAVVNTPLYRLLGIIVSKMLTLFVVNVIYVKFKKRNLYIGTSYWMLFLMMFATSIIAVFLIFKLSFDIDKIYMNNLSILCSFGLLFSTFFALYLYEHLAKQAETIRTQDQYERHLKMQLKHLDDILISQKQIKKFKHDFSNFQIGLQAYLDSGDLVGAGKYLKALRDKMENSDSIIETGNTALDAILSTKIAIAQSKKIDVFTKIQIPEDIMIDPIDMCIIFGNALDNAIEACDRVNNQDRRISITIICKDEVVLCKIVNTAPIITEDSLYTSKEDKQNHGFGLENIKTALAKYNANPTIERNNAKFILKFVIFTRE